MINSLSRILVLWCLAVWHTGYAENLRKSQANSYFFLKQNGGYEYGFNTDTGLQSAQTADQSNEVTGHYMYYEKGVPFMVKYRAGVNGFQPEIIPVEKLLDANFDERKVSSYNGLATHDSTTRTLHSSSQQKVINNHYSNQSPKVSSFKIGTDSTLNFVQNALKTIQNQPMHLSFTSESGQIQHHPSLKLATTSRPRTSTILQSVTRNDVQDINNLALIPPVFNSVSEPKQPYNFNYNADQANDSETSDPAGNVVGSYSYYDEAGCHDICYKANGDTGFIVLGGNLAHSQLASTTHRHQPQRRQLFRSNNFNFNNYRIVPDTRITTKALDERNLGKRSLRKFRRYAKW